MASSLNSFEAFIAKCKLHKLFDLPHDPSVQDFNVYHHLKMADPNVYRYSAYNIVDVRTTFCDLPTKLVESTTGVRYKRGMFSTPLNALTLNAESEFHSFGLRNVTRVE